MWTMRVARDWRWQLVPWVQPAVRAALGKVVRTVTTRAGVALVRAGVALVRGWLTTEMARRSLVMGPVGRALVTGQPWLEMRQRQETRAVWPRVVMVMDSECHRWVTGHCRSFQRLPGGTVHRAELA